MLFSGGLDSAVLLADAVRTERGVVQPLYVSTGLAWERDELCAIARLLEAAAYRDVSPLVHLRFDVGDIYPSSHWAIRGEAPGFDTPDEDVYLEGRNIALLSKASIFMARAGLTRVLIGPLAGNPFPDATPAFFDQFGRALSSRPRATDRDRRAVSHPAQSRRDCPRRRARRAAGANAVVHAADRRPTLRPVQQMPRTEGCVQASGDCGPYRLSRQPAR